MPFYRMRKIPWRKIFKVFGWTILSIIVLINLYIIISGKFHLYRAMANTLFNARLLPGIHNYESFENRVVKATNPVEWETHHKYAQNDLRSVDIDRLESIETESFLIIKHDSLYFEKYWEEHADHTKDSTTNSFSVAKSIVSILIGIAYEEGKIKSIDQPVGDYVKSYNKDGKEDITIRHLLTMSSGLNWDESASPFSDNTEAYYGWDLEELMDKQDVVSTPGKVFDYMSGNTQLLGFVLEKATGQTVSDYASEKLWGPLGCTSDALWNLDERNGHEKTFCCVYATTRDFARIGQLFINKGTWRGKRIVSESWVNQSITPADLKTEDGEKNTKYGLSWWLTSFRNHEVYYARGIRGQYIICVPDYDIVIVRTGYYRGDKLDSDHPEDVYWYIEAALAMIGK